MSIEKERDRVSNGSGKILPPPPGFASLTSFRMKRVRITDEPGSSKDDPKKIDNDVSERCMRQRPWILFDPVNPELDKSETTPPEKNFNTETCLPKGVIRGCSDCTNCLKVKARWRPEDAIKDIIEDAPFYRPTEEEYKDPIKYISSIRRGAEQYGICRIVPPRSWNPPSVKQDKRIWESSRFVTHVQRIDGIQIPYSNSEKMEHRDGKKRRAQERGFDSGCSNGDTEISSGRYSDTTPRGPEFTVEKFEKYADDFKGQYFRKTVTQNSNYSNEASIENIEGEYKRIVDNPTEEIEVLCYEDSEARILGSGFPTRSTSGHLEIVNSSWNPNNVPKLHGSLLSSEACHGSSVLVPRVHLGMCFTTQHWSAEEHHLYSLCYLHLGARKIWYCIPPRGSSSFQVALKNSFSNSFDKQHRLVKHLSPSALRSKGIPAYRCVQNPGEFVLVFPGIYHSGFDCGFNFSETANFAPIDWLPHGQIAVELYRDLGIKTSLSHDKLLLEAASKAIKALWERSFSNKYTPSNKFWKDACGEEGILTTALKFRVKCEEIERKFLFGSSTKTIVEKLGPTTRRECKICLCDLHFSAVACPCSPIVHSCLRHAEQLCDSCPWSDKFLLVCHDTADLNLTVEALEGKLKAVFAHAKEKLGMTLSVGSQPTSAPEVRSEHKYPSNRESILALLPSMGTRRDKAGASAPTPAPAPAAMSAPEKARTRAEAVAPKGGGFRPLLRRDLVFGSWDMSSSESSEDESDAGPRLVIKPKSTSS